MQTWLLLAAAEPSGDPAYVAAGTAVLGIDVDAGDLAEAGNLVRAGERIAFRHPLVRSAIYGGATAGQRRRVHAALAAVTRRAADTDRRAWHLAAGCIGPDEDVADVLERAAERARERGGYSARASLLIRAVELTPDGPRRTERTLAAAEAAMTAGRAMQTLALLDGLDMSTIDEIGRGRGLMIRASTQGFSSEIGAMATIPAICAAAADAFAARAPDLARDALVMAFERSLGAEWMMTGTTVADLAERARRIASPDRSSLADAFLHALAALATVPFPAAVPDIRAAIDALRADDLPDREFLRFAWVSVALTQHCGTTRRGRQYWPGPSMSPAGPVPCTPSMPCCSSSRSAKPCSANWTRRVITRQNSARSATASGCRRRSRRCSATSSTWPGSGTVVIAMGCWSGSNPPARRPWRSDWAGGDPRPHRTHAGPSQRGERRGRVPDRSAQQGS